MLLSLLLVAATTTSSAAPAHEPAPVLKLGRPPKEKGVGLGLFASTGTYDYSSLIREIRDQTPATHLSICWVWWQNDVTATHIAYKEGWSATDEQIVNAMKVAKGLGFHVTAFPIVRLVNGGKSDWRGKIRPSNEAQWWASYDAYIFHAAELAVRGGADRLSIGSELVTREEMRGRWSALIERLRLRASKLELMYSANWDHHREVVFWDLVDVVGITAYWELDKTARPSLERLVDAWTPVREDIREWSQALGRKIVITEIGYPSLEGTAGWPWNETRKVPASVEEQKTAYVAFARAWSNVDFIEGVYWWNWFGFAGPKDTGYTPRGKPALEVIRTWFEPRGE